MNGVTLAKIKDVAARAAWTFGQAFIAAFVLPPVAQFGSLATWKVVAFAAFAAGLSAAKSVLVNAGPSAAVKAATAPPAA